MLQLPGRLMSVRTVNAETGVFPTYSLSKAPRVRLTPARASLIKLDDIDLVKPNWKNWLRPLDTKLKAPNASGCITLARSKTYRPFKEFFELSWASTRPRM